MVRFLRTAATRPQMTRRLVNSKLPEASASPYSQAYSACAHAGHAAILSLAHNASKSITLLGIALLPGHLLPSQLEFYFCSAGILPACATPPPRHFPPQPCPILPAAERGTPK